MKIAVLKNTARVLVGLAVMATCQVGFTKEEEVTTEDNCTAMPHEIVTNVKPEDLPKYVRSDNRENASPGPVLKNAKVMAFGRSGFLLRLPKDEWLQGPGRLLGGLYPCLS